MKAYNRSAASCAFFLPIVILLVGLAVPGGTARGQIPGKRSGGQTLLPNGWSLTPAGVTVQVGNLPMNMAVDEKHNRVAVLNAGMGKHTVDLIDIQSRTILSSKEFKSLWLGIQFFDDGSRLAVSGGDQNQVYLLAVSGDSLELTGSIDLGKPYPAENISVAGIDVSPDGKTLFAVTKGDKALYVCDVPLKKVTKRVQLPAEAYSCRYEPKDAVLYVTLWGGREFIGIDVKSRAIVARVPVGSHPTDIALAPDGSRAFVANANENTVSVIDLKLHRVSETLTTALSPNLLPGSTPNSVALSPDGTLLFAANADNNCLAVFDISKPGESRPVGFIPTGWYPTCVRTTGKGGAILVLNGKGTTSLPNPEGPNPLMKKQNREQYIGILLRGSLSIIPSHLLPMIGDYTEQVYDNSPLKKPRDNGCGKGNPLFASPSPIKHVFYIIKENRTYDQVFGDMKKGNGAPVLCLFPDSITPNHHALANEFVLLDNLYCDAEVSADGHNWSMGAYASDFVEKLWPTNYSGRGGAYDFQGTNPLASPLNGYIWDNCARHGISYRSYGEFVGFKTDWRIGDSVFAAPAVPALEGHVAPFYPGWNLNIRDVDRAKIWMKEFDEMEKSGTLPQFEIVWLPNDHTAGSQTAMLSPISYVAENDLALGMIVERISRSSVWKESAIFVIEDDAQNGPDHVDAHRTVGLLIGPYVKRRSVDHTLYSTSSMVKSVEMILGLPAMTQYDSAATPMCRSFTGRPDFTPYTCKPAEVDLNRKNTAGAYGSRRSAEFDFTSEDRAPDIEFNEIIWKNVRGANSEMPAPVRSAFVKVRN